MREEIRIFAEQMEKVMSEHDKEKEDSWKTMDIYDLMDMLITKSEEVEDEISWDYSKRLKDEVIDLANFCMMVWNRIEVE